MSGKYLGSIVAVELAAAVVVTCVLAVPKHLPGVALESSLLFMAYRALIIFGALYCVTVVLAMSFSGSLASKLGTTGLEWTSKEAATTAAEQMLKLNLRLDDQANFVQNVVSQLLDDRARHERLEQQQQRVDRELQRLIVEVRALRSEE